MVLHYLRFLTFSIKDAQSARLLILAYSCATPPHLPLPIPLPLLTQERAAVVCKVVHDMSMQCQTLLHTQPALDTFIYLLHPFPFHSRFLCLF